jgi:hypothetical protein
MSDLFASAKRSLRRGQYHIFDLAKRLDTRLKARPPDNLATPIVEPNPDGVTETLKARFHPDFRDVYPCIIFDAVSNLRACLDQMTYAIAVPRGLPESSYAPFPIGKDVKWIDNQINGLKYLPPEIRALFRSFDPYKGGNDTLWALNELCNVKKHAALVPINAKGNNLAVRPGRHLLSGQARSVIMRGPVRITFGPFDTEKNEIEVGVYPLGVNAHTDTEFSFLVVFQHPEKVISGQHPVFLLDAMRREVERILSDTEAECRRIGIIP